MKIGDSIQLKKDYNVSVSLGNIGFNFARGSKGVILQVEGYTTTVLVGFNISDTVTVTALLDQDILEVIS